MGEVIAVIDTSSDNSEEMANWSYPAGYDSLKRIEVKEQDKAGTELWGVLQMGNVERQIPMPDLNEMWGYDTEGYQHYKDDPEAWEKSLALDKLIARVEALENRNTDLEQEVLLLRNQISSASEVETVPEPTLGPLPADESTTETELSPEPSAESETESAKERIGFRHRVNMMLGNLMTRRVSTTYEYDEEDRPINETVERRNSVVGYVGAAALGIVIFELIEHKIWGHSSSREMRQINHNHLLEMKAIQAHEHADKVRDAANHSAEMKAVANVDLHEKARHIGEIKAIQAHEHSDKVRAIHAHKHDLQATNGVLKAVNRSHATLLEHAGRYGSTQTDYSSGDFSGYSTPWSYTHNETQLHNWASKAASNGHKVRWIRQGYLPNGNVNEMLEIDGTTNTQRVLKILTQYK